MVLAIVIPVSAVAGALMALGLDQMIRSAMARRRAGDGTTGDGS
jgi:hypothetical protein